MNRIRSAFRRFWPLYLLMIPIISYYAVYRFYPMFLQAVLAFKKYRLADGVWGSPWVGWHNFAELFSKADFVHVLGNTVVISLLRLLFGFFPPIILAIFLFDIHSKVFRRFTQTIMYIPHFFSWVIIYAITFAVFSESGIVNQMLKLMNSDTVSFLVSPEWFRPILVGTAIWKEIGWGTIIYLAALSSLDPAQFEAAKLDGAGPVRRIIHVTLPGIAPVVVFLFTLQIGGILYAGGEQVLLYYNPATYGVGDIIDTWIYRQGLGQLQYSIAVAMSLFQSLFGLLLVLTANAISKKRAGIGLW
ncbi:ABC transporter permease [Cohnella silvisoli]|uniref:ABC transporter permease subunit n=1 Tax=Cohnella silvisoli TaxID=2873699 RepID=A0ABV1KSN1_9BACL|nr:ABC transporter permease subunit [Cohnella silvisoli]MCD9021367.1 ABC transporter permease subunit [Cohnella silvisoli]